MNGFFLTVAAVDRICYEGIAVSCTVGSTTGSRTFEAHHESFVSVLTPGVIGILEEGGNRLSIPVQDGLLRFDHNRCIIVVTLEVPS